MGTKDIYAKMSDQLFFIGSTLVMTKPVARALLACTSFDTTRAQCCQFLITPERVVATTGEMLAVAYPSPEKRDAYPTFAPYRVSRFELLHFLRPVDVKAIALRGVERDGRPFARAADVPLSMLRHLTEESQLDDGFQIRWHLIGETHESFPPYDQCIPARAELGAETMTTHASFDPGLLALASALHDAIGSTTCILQWPKHSLDPMRIELFTNEWPRALLVMMPKRFAHGNDRLPTPRD